MLSGERTLSVVLGWCERARFLLSGELRAAAVWRTAVTDHESWVLSIGRISGKSPGKTASVLVRTLRSPRLILAFRPLVPRCGGRFTVPYVAWVCVREASLTSRFAFGHPAVTVHPWIV